MPTRKVMAATITGLVVYAITKLGVQLDPVIEQGINVAAMAFAAWLMPEDKEPQIATLEGGRPKR